MINTIKKEKLLSGVLVLLRIIVGMLFIFSGFVKGVDPLGTTYKLTDYFNAFHVGFLSPAALVFSVILNLTEFVTGVALLLGVFKHFFIWIALLFMAVFTPLTLILAIYNPVTDCGCFGDAVIMTNWQTFFKNIVISAIIIFLFIFSKKVETSVSLKKQYAIILVSVTAFLGLSVYSYRHLPIVDFRPYRTGTYLPDGMKIPEGALADSFRITMVYRKNNIEKEFAFKDIPWQDTAWKWVETKNVLVRHGYQTKIHDFSFSNAYGEDITNIILHDTSFIFLAIAYDLEKASVEGIEKLRNIYSYCAEHNHRFYFATSSTGETAISLRDSLLLPYEFCNADGIMLKTVIRSNPGLVLIKDGTILDKWHYNDFPEVEKHPTLLALVGNEALNNQELIEVALFFSLLLGLIFQIRFIH